MAGLKIDYAVKYGLFEQFMGFLNRDTLARDLQILNTLQKTRTAIRRWIVEVVLT